MVVTFIDRNKKKLNISSMVTNYVLPDSGCLRFKDIQSKIIYINGNAFDVPNDKTYLISITQDNLDVEVDSVSYKIVVLCQHYRDETKFDYNLFGNAFHNNLVENRMGEYELFSAIEEDMDELKLPLCTFNRKFESITKDYDLNYVFKCVEKLPHIFQKPKLHLKQINEIRPAAVVSRIGQESISHLASHSEHWKGIKVNGLVPERLLARTLEDDYAIYENIAVKTVVDKLYKEMKQLNEENLDCHMQMDIDDGHAVGNENKDYFHARDILLRGMNDEEVFEQQVLLEDQKTTIDQILVKLGKCRSTPLYRSLKKAKPINGKLKKTNIFMMDKYYRYAFDLSETMLSRQEVNPYDTAQEVEEEYSLFCKVLFLFALRYFNFILCDESQDIFEEERFLKTSYYFRDWKLNIKDIYVEALDVNAFEVETYIDKPVEVELGEITLSNSAVKSIPDVELSNGKLILYKLLNQAQQDDLVKQLKKAWPSNRQKIWTSTLKASIYAAYSNYKPSSCKLLLIPWKYMLPDNSEELKLLLSKLKERVSADEYMNVFFLTPTRPNELSHIGNSYILNQLISYGMADSENNLSYSKYGIIPISIADMNSYRRFTKVILKSMVVVDSERNYCPICGNKKSSSGGEADNVSICHSCGYTLIDTICANDKCKSEYVFSRYQLPKVTSADLDNIGFKVIEKENRLGFKNITYAKIENGQINPVCPFCGK